MVLLLAGCANQQASHEPVANPQVKTQAGIVEGTLTDGIYVWKGVPFAAAPVGDLRFREPQPVTPYDTVLMAKQFGPDPMQLDIFGDMNFLGPSRSEDCLYLNIWAPVPDPSTKHPVLIYFNGGGWMAGSGSEPRYAGDSLAHKGVIAITANYREGVFGFLAHPEISAESPHHTSGNQGILDQAAAIQWVKDNIEAFGGDPSRITIAGESAGSFSASILMASPLSRQNLAGVIGSSGAEFAPSAAEPLANSEKRAMEMLQRVGIVSLADLRALPADSLQRLIHPGMIGMKPASIDGYLLPDSPDAIFARGEQAQVPLLCGWNANEGDPRSYFAQSAPTLLNFCNALRSRFDKAELAQVLQAYDIKSDDDVLSRKAVDLCSDLFTGFVSWKWCDVHQRTSGKPVFRYKFLPARPAMTEAMNGKEAGLAGGVKDKDPNAAPALEVPDGAVHSADIEYAMGNLATNHVYQWRDVDHAISQLFTAYYANFIKNGDPNGEGLPEWTPLDGSAAAPVMQIDVESCIRCDSLLENRYRTLDQIYSKRK